MLDCPGPNVVGHTRARDVVREPVFIEHYIRVNGNKRVVKKKKEKRSVKLQSRRLRYDRKSIFKSRNHPTVWRNKREGSKRVTHTLLLEWHQKWLKELATIRAKEEAHMDRWCYRS